MYEGVVPVYEGAVPVNEGAVPVNDGTVPVIEGRVPVFAGDDAVVAEVFADVLAVVFEGCVSSGTVVSADDAEVPDADVSGAVSGRDASVSSTFGTVVSAG